MQPTAYALVQLHHLRRREDAASARVRQARRSTPHHPDLGPQHGPVALSGPREVKVIVGSRELWPVPSVASAVLAIMVSTEDDFAVRCNRAGLLASGTEELASKIGERVGRKVVRFGPDGLTRPAGLTFSRDADMVRRSDKVYAFFASGQFMQGGTGHVVACALREGKPVEAYELDENGDVVEIATDEGGRT